MREQHESSAGHLLVNILTTLEKPRKTVARLHRTSSLSDVESLLAVIQLVLRDHQEEFSLQEFCVQQSRRNPRKQPISSERHEWVGRNENAEGPVSGADQVAVLTVMGFTSSLEPEWFDQFGPEI